MLNFTGQKKGRARSFIFCLVAVMNFIGSPIPVEAFDPFTVMAAAGVVADTVGSIAGDAGSGASELGDSLSALGDLRKELGFSSDETDESSMRAFLQESNRTEDALLEAGFTQEEVRDFLSQVQRGKRPFARNVRHLTSVIRRIKTLSRAFSFLGGIGGKGGSSANARMQTEIQTQSLGVLKDIHHELLERDLSNVKEKVRAFKTYQKMRKEEQHDRERRIRSLLNTYSGLNTSLSELLSKAFGISWAMIGVLVLLSGLFFALGLADIGKGLLVTTLTGGIFFLVITQLVQSFERNIL